MCAENETGPVHEGDGTGPVFILTDLAGGASDDGAVLRGSGLPLMQDGPAVQSAVRCCGLRDAHEDREPTIASE